MSSMIRWPRGSWSTRSTCDARKSSVCLRGGEGLEALRELERVQPGHVERRDPAGAAEACPSAGRGPPPSRSRCRTSRRRAWVPRRAGRRSCRASTVRSGRAGNVCTRFTLRPPSPNTFFLKMVGRSAAVTLSFSGVSASYMKSWSRELTRRRQAAGLARRQDVERLTRRREVGRVGRRGPGLKAEHQCRHHAEGSPVPASESGHHPSKVVAPGRSDSNRR